MLARIGAATRPSACVVGFDDPIRSLQRDRHAGYKSARPPKDDALVDLLGELPGLLRQLGMCVATPDGLEADDVLGSAAALARRRGVAAALATGDQDAFALVAPTVQVFYLVTGGRMEQVSPSWLRARYGSAGGLPGVHGPAGRRQRLPARGQGHRRRHPPPGC